MYWAMRSGYWKMDAERLELKELCLTEAPFKAVYIFTG